MKKNWTREEIVDLIIAIERSIKPEAFQIDGVLVWPWVRVKLFFFLLRTLERVELDKTPSEPVGLVKKIGLFIHSVKHWRAFNRIGKRKIMFVGAASHRASLEGVSYNKFFDPLREDPETAEQSVLIEYSKSTSAAFLSQSNFSFTDLMLSAGLFFRKKKGEERIWTSIVDAIKPVIEQQGLTSDINYNKLKQRLSSAWKRVDGYRRLWAIVLERVQPEVIFTLCYYSDAVYALNVIAAMRGVTTVEMQHGPINQYHLAYGSFGHMPAIADSSLLPGKFLVWDESSCQTLHTSFPHKQARIAGQPWIDFIEKKYPASKTRGKNIVFALQPVGEIGDQFPSFMVNWIRQSSAEYQWRLRLHPRQFHERPHIEEQLRTLLPGVTFDIDLASREPLPVVLRDADLVITNFSGVVLEAGFMGIPSIAVHHIARLYFMNEHNAHLTYVCDETDLTLPWRDIHRKALAHIQTQVDARVRSEHVFKEVVNLP